MQQSACGYGLALQGPRDLLKSIVGYGNVAVNRQQHSFSYLESGNYLSVSWYRSFAAQFSLTISP